VLSILKTVGFLDLELGMAQRTVNNNMLISVSFYFASCLW